MSNITDDNVYRNIIFSKQISTGNNVKLYRGFLSGTYEPIVLKVFPSKSTRKAVAEWEIHGKLRHPHIIRAFTLLLDFPVKETTIVMEYAPFGDLLDFINDVYNTCLPFKAKLLTENFTGYLFAQVLSATEYIHKLGYFHGDIKPENILIFPSVLGENEKILVKLADFGSSISYVPDRKIIYFGGSLHYSAPEIHSNKPIFGPEVDIWSLGVTLYTLSVGRLPIRYSSNKFERDVLESFRINGPYYPDNINLSNDLKLLISNMLKYIGEERITCKEIWQSDYLKYVELPVPGICRMLTRTPSPGSRVSKIDHKRNSAIYNSSNSINQSPDTSGSGSQLTDPGSQIKPTQSVVLPLDLPSSVSTTPKESPSSREGSTVHNISKDSPGKPDNTISSPKTPKESTPRTLIRQVSTKLSTLLRKDN